MFQTTIERKISFEGLGLHSGKNIKVNIYPAYADFGVQFKRSDVAYCEPVRVSPFSVFSTQLATVIKCGDLPISTIEHLTSALYGLGIDNVLIEVSGSEIPILDGSAANIVSVISDAGVKLLSKKRKYLKLKKRLSVEKDGKWVEMIPSRFTKYTFQIDFDNPLIGYQKRFFELSKNSYISEIADARTFGFKKDVDSLQKMGLAMGGSLQNAIVIDNDKILNPEGLRFSDEFVRHKILDLVGDLSLIGYRFLGHVRAYKSGHMLNNLFARTLIESTGLYTIEEANEGKDFITYTEFAKEPQGVTA